MLVYISQYTCIHICTRMYIGGYARTYVGLVCVSVGLACVYACTHVSMYLSVYLPIYLPTAI